MSDIREKLFLTAAEIDRIHSWIEEYDFSLDRGCFKLFFDFCPAFDDRVFLIAIQNGKSHYLELRDGDIASDNNNLCSKLSIYSENISIELTLSDKAVEKFYALARNCTAAHLEEDCEPTGYALVFEIHKDFYNVFGQNNFIEKRPVQINGTEHS